MLWLCRFFKCKIKQRILENDFSFHNVDESNDAISQYNYPDNKLQRLMELIGRAIEQWSEEYDMQKMPKKIIFEQALDAMKIMEMGMNKK